MSTESWLIVRWRSTPGQPGGAQKIRKNRQKALHRRHNQRTRLNGELDCLQTPAMN